MKRRLILSFGAMLLFQPIFAEENLPKESLPKAVKNKMDALLIDALQVEKMDDLVWDRITARKLESTGKMVYLRKSMNKKTGKFAGVSVDEDGQVITKDLNRVESKPSSSKLSDYVIRRIDATPNDKPVPVIINLRKATIPTNPYPKKAWTDANELKEWHKKNLEFKAVRRDRVIGLSKEVIGRMKNSLGTDLKGENLENELNYDGYSSTLYGNMTPSQIRKILDDKDVESIEFGEEDVKTAEDGTMGTIIGSSPMGYKPNFYSSFQGVAVWHHQFPASLSVPLAFDAEYSASQAGGTNLHFSNLLSLIRNGATCPDCGFASTSWPVFALNYLDGVQNSIDAVGGADRIPALKANIFVHAWHKTTGTFNGKTLDEDDNGGKSFYDDFIDGRTIQYPFPLFVQASGTIGFSGNKYIVHKGWNTLVVGAWDRGNPGNPLWRNYTVQPSSGMLLPHIVTDMTGWSGDAATSWAAGTTGGMIAGIRTKDATGNLENWPEAVRAIMIASGTNVVGNEGWNVSRASNEYDGSGYPHIPTCNTMAQRMNLNGPSGFKLGQVSSNTVQTNTITTTSTGKLQVALAWSSDPAYGFSDVDLVVYKDGSPVASSTSFSNNVEMVVVPNATAGTYEINVNGYTIPASFSYYAVAWTLR
jgi:hypothetical protein